MRLHFITDKQLKYVQMETAALPRNVSLSVGGVRHAES